MMRLPTMTISTLLFAGAACAQDEWRDAYRVGDAVELQITGDLWQRCVVSENAAGSVMRGRCEEFVEPAPGTYRRAGGTYILSRGDTRPARAQPAPEAVAAEAAGSGDFRVGEPVEIEASGRWLPCVVAENRADTIMRVRCDAYAPLSRDAGIYTVDRDARSVRRPGTAPAPVAAKPAAAPVATVVGLREGEYACYGSGGRILAGFAFRVLPGGRYTDLDEADAGTYTIDGDRVAFAGGHLDGQSGRALTNGRFRIGAQADCEPY